MVACREFCETNETNRLFRGLKVAKSGLNSVCWVGKGWFIDMILRFSAVFKAVVISENGDFSFKNGGCVVGFTDLYMVFGVSELDLCVSELGSEVFEWFSGGLHA